MLENPFYHDEDAKQQRSYLRRVGFVIFFAVAAALILLPLSGCATHDRYITDEQDAEFRQRCEPGGCVVLPAAEWNMIEKALLHLGLIRQ